MRRNGASLTRRIDTIEKVTSGWDQEIMMERRIALMTPEERQVQIKDLLREFGVPRGEVDEVFNTLIEKPFPEQVVWLQSKGIIERHSL